jgi:hypothetical protein
MSESDSDNDLNKSSGPVPLPDPCPSWLLNEKMRFLILHFANKHRQEQKLQWIRMAEDINQAIGTEWKNTKFKTPAIRVSN